QHNASRRTKTGSLKFQEGVIGKPYQANICMNWCQGHGHLSNTCTVQSFTIHVIGI
ncbi:hypothetical protein J6590_050069, partial [Homalodisca vitripennis]